MFANTSSVDVYSVAAAEFGADVPETEGRPAAGIDLVDARTPSGYAYQVARLGQRELDLFTLGRADLMDIEVISNGAQSWDVLTAKSWVRGGKIQYAIREDGVDHLCIVKPISGGRANVYFYKARGYDTTHNPEVVDRNTGFLKSDYAGGTYKTIQWRWLTTQKACFEAIEQPTTSYERGVYMLGAGVQWGGWKDAKGQLRDYLKLRKAGLPNEIGGVDFIEFLGHMSQASLTPYAWVVEKQEGYEDLPLEQQKVLSTAFVKRTACLTGWQYILQNYKAKIAKGEIGIYMKLGNG